MASEALIKKYKNLVRTLLPKGRLWRFSDGSNADKVFTALVQEFCRVEQRVKDLLFESDPRQAIELLKDWERMLALPDECTPDDLNEIDRRRQVVQKLTQIGALNADFYEFLGEQLGFEINVFDAKELRSGFNSGDTLFNFRTDILRAGDRAGDNLTDFGWRFFFLVELPATAATILRAGGDTGSRLREFENPLIECTVRKLKPAHTGVVFLFKEEAS